MHHQQKARPWWPETTHNQERTTTIQGYPAEENKCGVIIVVAMDTPRLYAGRFMENLQIELPGGKLKAKDFKLNQTKTSKE